MAASKKKIEMMYFLATICVVGIAVGQMLFKFGALTLQRSGSLFDPKTFGVFFIALALYGLTTILWVYVLSKADLGKVYPLMALAFVIVPVGSYFLFGERFQTQYFFGVMLIVLGIFVTIKS